MEEKPPLFKSWNAWYWLVLGAMFLQVIFYSFIAQFFR